MIIFLSLSSACDGKILASLAPKDKTTTQEMILTLKGTGKNLQSARVNGIMVDVHDNSFSCGLVLSPGKNFAKIEVWDKLGNYEVYTRRVLRLVSYPDAEELYNDKPHWAKFLVVTLSTLGIIEGYPDNNFYLNKSLTRGELATWISRAKGYKTFIPSKDVFRDVPKEHWRAPFIKEIADKGFMRGDDQGFFGVDIPVSRGEAAFTSIKAEGSGFEKEVVSIFYDVPESYPFYDQIKIAKSKGLVKGISWKTAIFEPQRDITRAEAAVLLSRYNRVKWLRKWLYDFNQGYNYFCKINTPPIIKDVQTSPTSIVLDGAIPVNLRVKVEDREGVESLLYVKADISQFLGPPDAEMHDDGEKGDAKKEDGEYVLQFIASPESTGEKTIKITAIDKLGWQGYGLIRVLVVK